MEGGIQRRGMYLWLRILLLAGVGGVGMVVAGDRFLVFLFLSLFV
jgi:hypothetical protein